MDWATSSVTTVWGYYSTTPLASSYWLMESKLTPYRKSSLQAKHLICILFCTSWLIEPVCTKCALCTWHFLRVQGSAVKFHLAWKTVSHHLNIHSTKIFPWKFLFNVFIILKTMWLFTVATHCQKKRVMVLIIRYMVVKPQLNQPGGKW